MSITGEYAVCRRGVDFGADWKEVYVKTFPVNATSAYYRGCGLAGRHIDPASVAGMRIENDLARVDFVPASRRCRTMRDMFRRESSGLPGGWPALCVVGGVKPIRVRFTLTRWCRFGYRADKTCRGCFAGGIAVKSAYSTVCGWFALVAGVGVINSVSLSVRGINSSGLAYCDAISLGEDGSGVRLRGGASSPAGWRGVWLISPWRGRDGTGDSQRKHLAVNRKMAF